MQALLRTICSLFRLRILRAYSCQRNQVQACYEPGARADATCESDFAVEEMVEHDGVKETAKR